MNASKRTSTHAAMENEVLAYRNHTSLLAWYLEEEPTGHYWQREVKGKNMSQHFEAYKAQYAAIKRLDPEHPIFVLDVGWITEPATEWWTKWNSYGDVSAHDNYALDYHLPTLAAHGPYGGDIPATVSFAADVNNESKPVWLCVQACPWRAPLNMGRVPSYSHCP